MLKSFFNWKVLLNIVIAMVVFIGLIFFTFRWLEHHTNHGQEIPVPNIINMQITDAIKTLEDAGLQYKVDSGEFQPQYKPLQVLQIWPAPGSRVKSNREIEIRINPKTWAKVTIPDILDRYKGLAFRQLEQVGLKIGDTIYEPSIQRDAVIRMQLDGKVLKPGDQVARFTPIDLVIGTGPKRNVPIPDLIGLTVEEAEMIIGRHLFEIGLVEYEDGKGDKTDIIYFQDPAGGALRDQGMQIDLWASKKVPSEMGDKISQLNSIYRTRVENIPSDDGYYINDNAFGTEHLRSPKPIDSPKIKPQPEKPKTETPKPKKEDNPQPKKENKPETSKPKDNQPKKPEEKPKPKDDKPKVKKVVVE